MAASVSRPVRSHATEWWKLGASAAVLGIEGAASYLHPAVGMVFAIIDIAAPLLIAATILSVILFGSDKRCDRVFRLLRWIANRPEP